MTYGHQTIGNSIRMVVVAALMLYGTTVAAANLTSHSNGDTLTGATVTFTWTGDPGITDYGVWVGTGVGQFDLFKGSSLGTVTEITISDLPTDGSQVYFRLWYELGTWQSVDYQFTAHTAALPEPVLTSHNNGDTLTDIIVTFTWNGDPSITDYRVWVGSGSGQQDIFDSGSLGAATGVTIRLAGSTLSSPTQLFTIDPGGATKLWLMAGTSVGASDYFDSGELDRTTSITATGLSDAL